MSKFSRRSTEEELMDDLDSSGEVIYQTLRELEIINKLLGGNQVTLNGLTRLLQSLDTKPARLKIVDLGCGGGDMLVRIAKWGKKNKVALELVGVDANPHIVAYARENTRKYPGITYRAINIFSDEFKQTEYDIVVSTLFTHHFFFFFLVELFRHCRAQARLGMVINDIHRHWFAYYSIKWLTRLFSKSEMVKNDAAVSVLRSFKRAELEEIIGRSGYHDFTLKWQWAFRWQLVAKH